MMLSSKISVVMPVFNGGAYFEAALETVRAQTYSNIEIIVVNDGSNDQGATDAIARRHAEADSRVKYILQPNKGVAGALNTALEHATGDYFAWLSHDDLFLPHKLEAQLSYANQIGNKDASLFSNYALIDQSGALICEVNQDIGKFLARPSLSLLNGGINGCTLLIPMHIMRAHGSFDLSLRFTQDYDFWDRILAQSDFFLQPEILVHYRIHADQGTNKPDAAIEGDSLWCRLLENRTDLEKAQLFGSRANFYRQMAAFLAQTPYKRATAFAEGKAGSASASEAALVSVVMPFFNRIELVARAAKSVLSQSHKKIELLLIDDGSTEPLDALHELARLDQRVCIIHKKNEGAASARNAGMRVALGEYVAFLDSDDVFLPGKIATQLEAMQRNGVLFSHTSYFVSYPDEYRERGVVNSGRLSGRLYPDIIAECTIATPTVMMHSLLVAEGYLFPEELDICEDVVLWTSIAQRHEILGLDEPLSEISWQADTSALNKDKLKRGFTALVEHFTSDAIHSRYSYQISRLQMNLRAIEEAAQDSHPEWLARTIATTFQSRA